MVLRRRGSSAARRSLGGVAEDERRRQAGDDADDDDFLPYDSYDSLFSYSTESSILSIQFLFVAA